MNKLKSLRVGITLALIAAALAACSLINPADSSRKANQAPETTITSGPKQNSVNSYFTRLAWKGEDGDGIITGYKLVVDGKESTVTITDSTFAFTAANKDEPHTVAIAAIDDQEAVDGTPATLTFTAKNTPPNTSLQIEGNPTAGATFGRGGVFTIVPFDPDNGPEYSYRFKIDDSGAWSAWLNNPEIEFSLNSAFGLLPIGQHTFFAQVRDAGLAVDETPVSFPITVSATVKPLAALTASFNGHVFFSDSSTFLQPDSNTVDFAWSASFNYAGARSGGSRYRSNGGNWTEYSTSTPSLRLTNVAAGDYTFEIQFRDIAGTESEVVKYRYAIVTPTRNAGILLIDDRNGARARDTDVDNFYAQVLQGAGVQKITSWDIATQGPPTPKKGMGQYSAVIWQSDEDVIREFPKYTQLVTDYLTAGGKLWLSGWRMLQTISGSNSLSNDFRPSAPNRPAGADFVFNILKVASSSQNALSAFDFSGAQGVSGYPNISVETTKSFPAGRAGLPSIEIMTLADGAQAIYSYNSVTGNPDFQGKPAGLKYLGTRYKLVVLGFPFYPIKLAEAIPAARQVLTELGEL